MRCKIKKLSGFTIYYLHNSDKCSKCLAVLKSELEIDRSYQKFGHQKKIPSKKSLSDNYKPLKELVLGTQKVLKSEFVFPVPLDAPANIPSKQNKVLKRICSKDLKAVKALQITKIPSNNKKISPKQTKVLKRICNRDLKAAKALQITKSPSNDKKKNSKSVKPLNKPPKKTTALKGNTTLNSVKQKSCNSNKKVNGSKVPSKGTLKRKRWFLNKLSDKNDDYEDDIFENRKFEHFQTLLEDETDSSEKFEDLQTPVFPFSISPAPRTPSPTYQDCYSPTQLSIYRKGAEEYHYRRKIRRKLNLKEPKEETPQIKPLCREDDIRQRLEEVVRILNEQQSQTENSSDSEDDQYFSDLLNQPCEVNHDYSAH